MGTVLNTVQNGCITVISAPSISFSPALDADSVNLTSMTTMHDLFEAENCDMVQIVDGLLKPDYYDLAEQLGLTSTLTLVHWAGLDVAIKTALNFSVLFPNNQAVAQTPVDVQALGYSDFGFANALFATHTWSGPCSCWKICTIPTLVSKQ